MSRGIDRFILAEGWEIIEGARGVRTIKAFGEVYPYSHPFAIHAKRYREAFLAENKYYHMKAMHDYLWPDAVWNYWTERRFRRHCEGKNYIVYAGGAGTGKSHDAAKIAILFWLGNPKKRTVIVASTTLESLNSRIWGYVQNLLGKMKVEIPYVLLTGKPPKVLYKQEADERGKAKDTIHGMFAVAATQGSDDDTIANWIGRHPEDSLMVILDEATDMPVAILGALPNLESKSAKFQLMAIGNSNDLNDLHGALSTPEDGWNTIDPSRDTEWRTTYKNGVCLFFSCYESPAIHESDPKIREKCRGFFITQEEINEKKLKYGEKSIQFYRFVLGFWRSVGSVSNVMSKEHLDHYDLEQRAHWSGMNALAKVAGVDLAIRAWGDNAILRIATLGQTWDGRMVLDYGGQEMCFKLPLIADLKDRNGQIIGIDMQIAIEVVKLLRKHNIRLEHVCLDANNGGTAVAELIRLELSRVELENREVVTTGKAWMIHSIRHGQGSQKASQLITKTSYEMYMNMRGFIQNNQIYGLDELTLQQIANRRIKINKKVNAPPQLEDKQTFKQRMSAINPALAHSPDEADTAILALYSAIFNFGFGQGQVKPVVRASTPEDMKRRAFDIEQAEKGVRVKRVSPIANFSKGIEASTSKRRNAP
jgi:hypothetical protein